MVATTKGPADSRKTTDGTNKTQKKTAVEKKLQSSLDFTQQEWDHLSSHAANRSVTVEEAIRLAIEATYGRPMNAQAHESSDPS